MKRLSKPFFLQLDTYRYVEHCGPISDDYLKYRDKNEIKKWLKDDPIENFMKYLKKNNQYNEKEINKIKNIIATKIKKAFEFAKKDDFPKPSTLKKYVYA